MGALGLVAATVLCVSAGPGEPLQLIGPADPGLLAQLTEGLERLPAPLREFPGGVLELELHPEPRPYGMGDGTSAPIWSDGHRRFHLYAVSTQAEPRAAYRLERLDSQMRQRLWRERAIVHAVLQRWDDARQLSRSPQWRALNAWEQAPLSEQERPLNKATWAYSRELGRGSAALDLLTFAEELFVPATALAGDAVPRDDQVECQELSKRRVLAALLESNALGSLPPRGPCPRFDAWADPDSLEGFEALLVAASGRKTESLFGHVLLRERRRQGVTVEGPSFGHVIQLVAFTGSAPPTPAYALQGLTGGFSLGVVTLTEGNARREISEYEQRNIRRFDLHLTRTEQVRLQERTWELERRGEFAYFFLTDNCAQALLRIVGSVLDPERQLQLRPPPGWSPVLPGAVLDALAAVQVLEQSPEGARVVPLLTPRVGELESTQDVALRADQARTTELAKLRELDPRHSVLWRRVEAELSSAMPRARRVGYARALLLGRELEHQGTDRWRPLLFSLLAHSAQVERYLADVAETRAVQAQLDAVERVDAHLSTGEEEVASRQRLFERETPLARAVAELDRMGSLRDAILRAPKRPLRPEEQALVDRSEETSALFSWLTDEQARWNTTTGAGLLGARWLEQEEQARLSAEHERVDRSLERSGYARAAVGGGVAQSVSGAGGSLVLRAGALDERLGDQRQHGFRSTSELRVLDSETVLALQDGRPRLVREEVTLIGYRSVQRDLLANRAALEDALGWGMRLGVDYREGWRFATRGELRGEAMVLLDSDPRAVRLTAVGLGASAQLRFSSSEAAVSLAPRLSLTHVSHPFGSFANRFSAEVAYLAGPELGTSLRLTQTLTARAELTVELSRLGQFHLVAGPALFADSGIGPTLAAEPLQAGAQLLVELL